MRKTTIVTPKVDLVIEFQPIFSKLHKVFLINIAFEITFKSAKMFLPSHILAI